jgi:NTE family protein
MDFSCPATTPRIGLALGGGGARGLAHLHVLEALDDLGLRPAAVTGTSIGALIGAASAAGLSGREAREVSLAALGKPADVWSRIWNLRPRSFAHLAGGIPLFDPEAVVAEFLPREIPADFSDLALPFSTIATDFYGAAEVRLDSGPVRRAVAASIALPVIFRPVELDGATLIDGGIVNPLPFDRLPADVDITIAVDVVGSPERPDKRSVPNAREALFGASQVLMQALIAEKLRSRVPDILIRPPVDRFRVLDFMKIRDILEATAAVRETVKRGIEACIEGNGGKRIEAYAAD